MIDSSNFIILRQQWEEIRYKLITPECYIVKLLQSLVCRKNFIRVYCVEQGFPRGSMVKNTLVNSGDMGLIPGLGRSPREGNGNPLQYSCLGNPMYRGA